MTLVVFSYGGSWAGGGSGEARGWCMWSLRGHELVGGRGGGRTRGWTREHTG